LPTSLLLHHRCNGLKVPFVLDQGLRWLQCHYNIPLDVLIKLIHLYDYFFCQVKRLPGVDLSREEQLKRLEFLRTQLRLKRELLLKYRTTCTFEIPPSATSNSNSFSSPLSSSTQQQQQINTNSLPTSNAQPIVNSTGKA
jgi:mediator of RNA polymerase II transcription subunit 9